MDSLFAFDGQDWRDWREIRDYSYLAADRPSYQCAGKPREIHGPHGELITKWPCGRILPDFCFRPRWSTYTCSRYRPVMLRCIACEQEIREAKKSLWEHETKAQTALSHHMQRERQQGLHDIRSLADYQAATGVTIEILADEFRRAEQQDLPCPHCEVPWSKMAGGWRMQMSLDRTDQKRMLALDNFTLKCRSGNSQRKDTNPRVAAVRDAYWRLIRRERRGEVA